MLVLLSVFQISAQPATTTRVLELDGNGSYVELPAGAFTNLDEVTVEGWIKWESFESMSRFFDFTLAGNSLDVHNYRTSSTLFAELFHGDDWTTTQLPQMLALGRWTHVAAVSGKQGLQLFVDGTLVSTNIVSSASFSTAGLEKRNLLGRSNFRVVYTNDADFHGQMDEVRIWKGLRTEEQIRENMFKNLTGGEPGLVGLWNFDHVFNGVVKDLSPGAHDGKLIGNARIASAQLPTSAQLLVPAVVFGTIEDDTGKPVANATIRLLRQEAEIATATSDTNGSYSTAFFSEYENFDVNGAAGELGNWKFGIACPHGERTEVNLTLSNSVSLAGKVTAFDGSLIEDAVIQVVRADASALDPGKLTTPGLVATMLTATTTNSSEAYRFVNLRPGDYKVMLHGPDAQHAWHGGEIVHVAPGKTFSADFQLAPFRKGRWRHYSTANGLPSTRIYNLQFMPDGTLLLATQNGVSRFDGFTFTTLSKRDGLLDNRVFCIYRAPSGLLWFGTEEGVSRFDPGSRRFENFPSGTNGLTAGRVMDIAATPDGILWLRTSGGLSRYDGQSFHAVPGIPIIPQVSSWTKTGALAVDRQNRVWTVTEFGDLWRIDGTNVVRFTTADGLPGNNPDALYIASDDALWLANVSDTGNSRSITRYDGGRFDNLRAEDMADNSFVSAIGGTPDGTLWFGHYVGGATRYDPHAHSLVRFGPRSGAPQGWVTKIRAGPDGAVWFASASGLYRYEEETLVNFTKADGLPDAEVNVSAMTKDGALWFSGYKNDTPLVRLKLDQTNRWENPFVNATDLGLPNFPADAMAPDAVGGLWVGGLSDGRGVYYYDPGASTRSEKSFREARVPEIFRRG